MEIKAVDIRKSFGSNEVLKGLTLTIKSGSICTILGGSGSGKSVFLKHLTGLVRPDSGSIFVDGNDITRFKEEELFPLRRRIAMIFQSGGLLGSMTVGENVGLGLVEHRMASPEEIARVVRQKLALVHLEGKENEIPANLSGGMKKRVSIARALTLNPELILYDEPTAGLDPPMAETIDDLILELTRDLKVTSVVVTHDLKSVFKLGGTLNMLHDGRIVESAEAGEFRNSDNAIVREFLRRGV
ncbi:MAG TPA: ATP-binding cassette domain-containing protein [Candidatus Sumerlaeota bacterium]|nr:ATP-binding cassette domain-containing protein [Candidatus Sumerlaeota bacterium]